jgi:hypothetical protein
LAQPANKGVVVARAVEEQADAQGDAFVERLFLFLLFERDRWRKGGLERLKHDRLVGDQGGLGATGDVIAPHGVTPFFMGHDGGALGIEGTGRLWKARGSRGSRDTKSGG